MSASLQFPSREDAFRRIVRAAEHCPWPVVNPEGRVRFRVGEETAEITYHLQTRTVILGDLIDESKNPNATPPATTWPQWVEWWSKWMSREVRSLPEEVMRTVVDIIPALPRHILEGACRVERYRYGDSKVIHLFYDIHGRRWPCKNPAWPVEDFLEHVVTTTPQVVDLVLETHELELGGPEVRPSRQDASLQQIRYKFFSCFDRLQRTAANCPYPRARFHFNDWRQNRGTFTRQLLLLLQTESQEEYMQLLQEPWYLTLFHQNMAPSTYPDTWPQLYTFLKAHQTTFISDLLTQKLGSDDMLNLERWDALLRQEMRVDKQLAHCTPDVQRVIQDWLQQQLSQERFMTIHAAARDTLDVFHLFRFVKEIGILYMDAYTIARMFRQFRSVPGQYSEPMRNIWIYSGWVHCENYRALLLALGAQRDAISRSVCTNDEAEWVKNGPTYYCRCQDVSSLMPWVII